MEVDNLCATVVLADRKSELTEIIKYIMENPNYKDIHIYSNAKLAINEIPQIQCQLIFVDADIKLLNIKEWIRVVLKKYPNINLVVVSAKETFALEALKIGVMDFLIKPITQESLVVFEKKFERIFSNKNINH